MKPCCPPRKPQRLFGIRTEKWHRAKPQTGKAPPSLPSPPAGRGREFLDVLAAWRGTFPRLSIESHLVCFHEPGHGRPSCGLPPSSEAPTTFVAGIDWQPIVRCGSEEVTNCACVRGREHGCRGCGCGAS